MSCPYCARVHTPSERLSDEQLGEWAAAWWADVGEVRSALLRIAAEAKARGVEYRDLAAEYDQARTNERWLLDRINRIHAVLCPVTGTWQERAEQAVAAAEAIGGELHRVRAERDEARGEFEATWKAAVATKAQGDEARTALRNLVAALDARPRLGDGGPVYDAELAEARRVLERRDG